MQASRLVLAGLIAFAIGIATWLAFRSLPKFKPRGPEQKNASTAPNSPDAGSAAAPERAAASKPATRKPALKSLDEAPQYDGPVRNRERADQLRELLKSLYSGQLDADDSSDENTGQRDAGSDSPGERMPEPVGDGNQSDKPLGAYIQRMMQEQFKPLASECYEQLRESSPFAEGNVSLQFSIMGDPAVGGVVVDVGFGAATTLNETEFATCIRESMYAAVFDAPPKGSKTVTVKHSMEFSP